MSVWVGMLGWLSVGVVLFAARLWQLWLCSVITVAVQAWKAETGNSLRTVFVRRSGCCVFLWQRNHYMVLEDVLMMKHGKSISVEELFESVRCA